MLRAVPLCGVGALNIIRCLRLLFGHEDEDDFPSTLDRFSPPRRLVRPRRRCYDLFESQVPAERGRLYEDHPRIGLLAMFAVVEPTHAAAPTLSFDGKTLSLSAENQTFGQVMGLFQRQLGLEIDIPG